MKLRVQTDYALRTLMYLAYTDRTASARQIADHFAISKDHLTKVIQLLARHGYVRTTPGRGGGVSLRRAADRIVVREVVERFEGRNEVLDCVATPEVCPLEPGCRLRGLLIRAEAAFFETLSDTTVADLTANQRRGGMANLPLT